MGTQIILGNMWGYVPMILGLGVTTSGSQVPPCIPSTRGGYSQSLPSVNPRIRSTPHTSRTDEGTQWSYSREYTIEPMISRTIRFLTIWPIHHLSITRLSFILLIKIIYFLSVNFVLTFHTIISHRILTDLNGVELVSSNCIKLSLFQLRGNGKPISLTYF